MSPPFPIPVGFFGSADDGIVTAGLEVHLDAGNPASYPGTGTTWTDMISGTAFTFAATPFYNGTIGYFNFTSNDAAGTFIPTIAPTRGAVEIWFRWRDFSPITAAVLLTGGANWFALGNTTGSLPDESIEFNSGVSAVMDDRQGHTYYRDNEWHQMVAVIDGTANLLYVDGVAVATTFRSGSATSTGLTSLAGTLIGRYSGAGYQFDGDIAIVRVYDTGAGSFSATDVAQNYAADSPRFAAFQPDSISGLRFWLDPSDASTVTTAAGNVVSIQDKALVLPAASAVSAVGFEPALATVGGINWMQFTEASTEYQTLYKNNGVTGITGLDLYGGGTNSWEIVMVLRPDSATRNVATTYQNNGIYADTGGYIGVYLKNPGLGNLEVKAYMWDGSDKSGTLTQAPATKVVFGHSKAAGTQPWSQWVNGVQTVLGTNGNLTSVPGLHYLGQGYNTYYYDGLIGEVCIFDNELSATDRTNLTNYLIAKWGV